MLNAKIKRITAILFALTLLSSCQQSPESSIVVHKDLDKLIEQAKESGADNAGMSDISQAVGELEAKYNTYKTTIDNKTLHVRVNVDAKVDIPAAEKMSVLRVAQKPITQELLDNVRRELLGDTALYDGMSLDVMTKSDIEASIAELREIMKNETPDTKKALQERIDKLEASYDAAPVEIDFSAFPTDGKLRTVSEMCEKNPESSFYPWLSSFDPNGEIFYGVSDGKDGRFASVYVLNSAIESNHIAFRVNKIAHNHVSLDGFFPDGAVYGPDGQIIEPTPTPGETTTLSLEEATALADKFLEKVGISDFAYYDGSIETEYVSYAKGLIHPADFGREYYVLTYSRVIGGAAVTIGAGDKNNMGSPNYSAGFKKMSWPTERIEFRINDDGIVGFDYLAPLEIKEVVVEDSSLRSYESVIGTFEKMIAVTQATEELTKIVDIDRVIFGYALVSEPDSYDTGLLVPVWDFMGEKKLLEDGYEIYKATGAMLTVNAVDGSVIDRQLGY